MAESVAQPDYVQQREFRFDNRISLATNISELLLLERFSNINSFRFSNRISGILDNVFITEFSVNEGIRSQNVIL